MKLRTALALSFAIPAAFALPGAAFAQSDKEAAEKIINNHQPKSFLVYGMSPPPKVRKDPGVQEGEALRISAPGGGNQWDVSVNVPVLVPIKAGDNIVIYFWARAEKPPEGKTNAIISAAQLQLASEPYTSVFSGSMEVGPEWKLYHVEGKADKNYAARALNIVFHLNGAKQVIDIGLVAGMNNGQ